MLLTKAKSKNIREVFAICERDHVKHTAQFVLHVVDIAESVVYLVHNLHSW